jgi:hypothetical protein
MPTVADVLRESGFSDDQISSMDQRAITAFTGVLTTAQREREQAELAQRSNIDFYENRIAPSLVNWDEEKTRLDNEKARAMAEVAFYRTQNEEARRSGFIASDAPGFNGQPRDGQGRYVAGAPGGTPGSPQYYGPPQFDVNKVYERAGDAVNIISDISWEHEKLFGQKLPISPSELIRQADAVKMDPRSYAARQFNWDQKRKEMETKAKQDEVDRITREVEQRKDREWAERVGSNPDVRMPQANPRFTDIAKGVRAGTVRDPIMLSENERRLATRQMIRADLAEAER